MLVTRNWVTFSAQDAEQASLTAKGQAVDLIIIEANGPAAQQQAALTKLRETWPSAAFLGLDCASQRQEQRAPCLYDFMLRKPFTELQMADILADIAALAQGRKRRQHILIIEDSATVRRIVSMTAREAGLRPSVATRAEEALVQLSWDKLDVVLTDIFMEGMGGIEAIMRMRTLHPELIILAMSSGLGSDMDPAGALKAAEKIGADRTLRKPFTADQLALAVRAVALQRQARESAAA
jgi:DNA-binding response OmpR family regulator